MTAGAAVTCSDPVRLARAMARHFGHKVPVEESGGVTRVLLSAGRLELRPDADRLEVRASADEERDLADVKRIAGDHLARFARPEIIDVHWTAHAHRAEEGSVDTLERAALEWIAPYWNARHLVRTRDWLLELHPHAGLALRLAALTHDVERHFPGGPTPDPSDPGYPRKHAERSAAIVDDWLESQAAPAGLIREVTRLVAAHEGGGWPEADLLQAADSLSFLEVNSDRPAAWVRDRGIDPTAARAKLRHMHDRIAVAGARGVAAALLDEAERRFDRALAESGPPGDNVHKTGRVERRG